MGDKTWINDKLPTSTWWNPHQQYFVPGFAPWKSKGNAEGFWVFWKFKVYTATTSWEGQEYININIYVCIYKYVYCMYT